MGLIIELALSHHGRVALLLLLTILSLHLRLITILLLVLGYHRLLNWNIGVHHRLLKLGVSHHLVVQLEIV